jgi:hypothetical protein
MSTNYLVNEELRHKNISPKNKNRKKERKNA